MSKQEFLVQLQKKLSGLPQEDIEDRVSFYSEIIDDRMEEGLTEEEAVEKIGPVNEVVSQIIAETPLPKLVKQKARSRRRLGAFEIVLLILGSPIWISLLIAAFAVVLFIYVVLWAVVVSLWAAAVSVAAGAIGGVLAALTFVLQNQVTIAIAVLGTGICCAGIAILFFYGCKAVTKGISVATKKIALGIKYLFVGKEAVK